MDSLRKNQLNFTYERSLMLTKENFGRLLDSWGIYWILADLNNIIYLIIANSFIIYLSQQEIKNSRFC